MSNKEFKIFLKKLSKIEENTERQINKISKTIHKQKKFSKEKETTKRSQTNFSMMHTMTELKKSTASKADSIKQKKETELKDYLKLSIQRSKKKKGMKKAYRAYLTSSTKTIHAV